MHLRLMLLSLGLLFAATACEPDSPEAIPDDGGSGGEPGGGGGDGGPAGDYSWSFQDVASDNDGWLLEAARAPDGTIGVAWMRPNPTAGTCVIVGPSGPQEGPVDRWDVYFAQDAGGTFTPELVVTIESAGVPEGLSLAFDDAGQAHVAYTGGLVGANQCGGSDMILATRTGGGWSPATIDATGAVTGMAFPEDGEACAAYQNACNQGDVVGPWPALAFVGGAPVLAYRDVHFGGLGIDSLKNADVQLSWPGGLLTLDATYGGGMYTRIAAGEGGAFALAHYDPFHLINEFTQEYMDGIWVIRWDGAAWSRQRIVQSDKVGFGLGFDSAGPRLGLAYRTDSEKRLFFLESQDGATWGAKELVDQAGNTGKAPSFRYDPDGNPVIAYHRCGPAGEAGSDCLPPDDSLKLAVKKNGAWRTSEVRNERGGQEGEYLSLVFDGAGNPVIAFQAVFFDPVDGTVIRKLVVAKGSPR